MKTVTSFACYCDILLAEWLLVVRIHTLTHGVLCTFAFIVQPGQQLGQQPGEQPVQQPGQQPSQQPGQQPAQQVPCIFPFPQFLRQCPEPKGLQEEGT